MESKLRGPVEMTDAEIDVVAGGQNTNYGIQQRTHAAKSGNQVVSGNHTSGSAYAYYNSFNNYNYNSGSVHYYSPPPTA
jgi:hypothetical protein